MFFQLPILKQTEARRAERNFFGDPAPPPNPNPPFPPSQGLDDQGPLLYLTVWIRHCWQIPYSSIYPNCSISSHTGKTSFLNDYYIIKSDFLNPRFPKPPTIPVKYTTWTLIFRNSRLRDNTSQMQGDIKKWAFTYLISVFKRPSNTILWHLTFQYLFASQWIYSDNGRFKTVN